MARLILLLVIGCIAGTASAQTPRCPDETTAGMRRCNREMLERLEAELNRVYQQARAQAADTAALDSAQAAWLRYVELDCRAAASVYSGGSLAPVVAGSCRLDHIRRRVRHLRDDYLNAEGAPGRRPRR